MRAVHPSPNASPPRRNRLNTPLEVPRRPTRESGDFPIHASPFSAPNGSYGARNTPKGYPNIIRVVACSSPPSTHVQSGFLHPHIRDVCAPRYLLDRPASTQVGSSRQRPLKGSAERHQRQPSSRYAAKAAYRTPSRHHRSLHEGHATLRQPLSRAPRWPHIFLHIPQRSCADRPCAPRCRDSDPTPPPPWEGSEFVVTVYIASHCPQEGSARTVVPGEYFRPSIPTARCRSGLRLALLEMNTRFIVRPPPISPRGLDAGSAASTTPYRAVEDLLQV